MLGWLVVPATAGYGADDSAHIAKTADAAALTNPTPLVLCFHGECILMCPITAGKPAYHALKTCMFHWTPDYQFEGSADL